MLTSAFGLSHFWMEIQRLIFMMVLKHWLKITGIVYNLTSVLIIQTVKETIGVGVNEKAALSSDKNCPFVYINFDFTLVNKVASL